MAERNAMRWVFSDGTVYEGGRVQGTSALAEAIRRDVSRANDGSGVYVQVEMCPAPARTLDLDDAQLVHEWLFQHGARAGATITSAPELEPIERLDYPVPDDDPPGTRY